MHGVEVRAQEILMQSVEANETDDQRDAADRRRDVGQDEWPRETADKYLAQSISLCCLVLFFMP